MCEGERNKGGRCEPPSLYPSPTSPTNFSSPLVSRPLPLPPWPWAAFSYCRRRPGEAAGGSSSMVSLRRRRLLGLCSGKDSLPVDLPKPVENEKNGEVEHANVNPLSVHPLPLTRTSDVLPESSNGSDSLKEEKNQYYPGKEIKRRKRHRRKQYVDQEPCIMRGVYFKNMKWQAAIKVDKKQIHLGTVGTQDEAARLYDRAAFMCGREPNFELSEEEKNELVKYTWDDFLAMTRNTITSKKQRKVGSLRHNKADLFIGDTEMVNGGGSSNSDDGDVDTSVS
ncbi:hypothetical protein ZWY2020_040962 [Hordeum vulgare]|nr:hypothetical protein ZWY2020_040962 [Hordeum vulgare]